MTMTVEKNINCRVVIEDAKNKSVEEFLKLYKHPFLVQYDANNSANQEVKKEIIFATTNFQKLEDFIKADSSSKKIVNIFSVQKTDRNPFASKIIVGRTASQDIIIDSDCISKFHAYFEIKGSYQYTLTDRGSTNGTSVKGEKLKPSEPIILEDGNKIQFAVIPFNFYFPETAYQVFKFS